jgi:hypothetical protein
MLCEVEHLFLTTKGRKKNNLWTCLSLTFTVLPALKNYVPYPGKDSLFGMPQKVSKKV